MRAAVERADLGPQLLDVGQPLRRRRPCRCPPSSSGSGDSSPPSTRSPPMPAVRLSTTSTSGGADRARRPRGRAPGRAAACRSAGSRTWMCDDRRARPRRPRSPRRRSAAGVTGTRSLCPVVSPAPVTAQVMKASQFTDPPGPGSRAIVPHRATAVLASCDCGYARGALSRRRREQRGELVGGARGELAEGAEAGAAAPGRAAPRCSRSPPGGRRRAPARRRRTDSCSSSPAHVA